MRSLVTGGAGFLGQHLVNALIAGGDQVLVVDSAAAPRSLSARRGVEYARIDVRERVHLADAVERFEPSAVFHLAAQADPKRAHSEPWYDLDVNVSGTLSAALAAGNARFVFVSTGGAMYGDLAPAQIPAAETRPANPTSPYGLSKYCAELYLAQLRKQSGLSYTILRPGNIYGPGQKPGSEVGVAQIFLEQLLNGQTPRLRGHGRPTRDYVYVSDVVDALLLAAVSGGPRAYNIASGQQTSVRQIFDFLCQALSVDIRPDLVDLAPGEVTHVALDCRAAHRDLGWTPKVPLAEGLARTAGWARQLAAQSAAGT